MNWAQFETWLVPACLGALAVVSWGVAKWAVYRIDERMTSFEKKVDGLADALNKDLRYMSERMVRVETFLKLPPLPPSQ